MIRTPSKKEVTYTFINLRLLSSLEPIETNSTVQHPNLSAYD